MTTRVNWSISASIAGGPAINTSQSKEIDAYEVVTVTVPTGESVDVAVQPADDAADLIFFAITSSAYGSALTFSVDGGVSDQALDGALVLAGGSIAGLLGAPPQQITFNNGLDSALDVVVLVGREAEISS